MPERRARGDGAFDTQRRLLLPAISIIGGRLLSLKRCVFGFGIRLGIRTEVLLPLHVFVIWH